VQIVTPHLTHTYNDVGEEREWESAMMAATLNLNFLRTHSLARSHIENNQDQVSSGILHICIKLELFVKRGERESKFSGCEALS